MQSFSSKFKDYNVVCLEELHSKPVIIRSAFILNCLQFSSLYIYLR